MKKLEHSVRAFLVGVIGIFILKEMINNDESQIVTEEGAEYLSTMKIKEPNNKLVLENEC